MLKNARDMLIALFAEKLGLDDLDSYAVRMISNSVGSERLREYGPKHTHENVFTGSGRTTRMLLSALVDVADGKSVHLVTSGDDTCEAKLRDWAKRLDLEPCNVTTGRPDPVLEIRELRRPAEVIHIDHACVDRPVTRIDFTRKVDDGIAKSLGVLSVSRPHVGDMEKVT